MPSFPFSFEAPGLTLNQKLALAATKACPVCCGSGSGAGNDCCVCFSNTVDGSGNLVQPRPSTLFGTFTNSCMPSSPLTIEMSINNFWDKCISISGTDTIPSYSGSVIVTRDPSDSTGISCANGTGIIVTESLEYALFAALYCWPCGNESGSGYDQRWLLAWNWYDYSGNIIRWILNTNASLFPDLTLSQWDATILDTHSCYPVYATKSVPTVCENEVYNAHNLCCYPVSPGTLHIYCESYTTTTTCDGSVTDIVIME